jgi:hypothetical protein
MFDQVRMLIYGDSNSWGYLDDGQGKRYHKRWPIEMCKHLSKAIPLMIIEECLPGRTTDLDDPVMGNGFNGRAHLETVLRSHQPLDHIVIMLGTNDLKARFDRSAEDIAKALVSLGQFARSIAAGRGSWALARTADVTLISPLTIGRRASNPAWERAEEWMGAYEKSAALPSAVQAAGATAGFRVIDGNQFGVSSERDPIHWAKDTHNHFGAGIASLFQQQFLT